MKYWRVVLPIVFGMFFGAAITQGINTDVLNTSLSEEKISDLSTTTEDIILETSFEEKWEIDSDGDYYAPPGWDVDGLCKASQSGFPADTHYWNDMHDGETRYDLSQNGTSSACIRWSDGNGEEEDVGYKQNEWLITPELNFSIYSEIILTFWSTYWWNLECNHSNFIKISTDNGSTWEILADLVNEPQWRLGGNDGEDWKYWNHFEEPITIDLSRYKGETVRIAWNYYSPGDVRRGIWVVDDVKITGVRDSEPPLISVEKPEKAIYINNYEIIPFITSIAFGKIDIEVSVKDSETSVKKVEFYLDNELKTMLTNPPYSWELKEKMFKRCIIRIMAYDKADNTATEKIILWKFF